MFGAGNYSFALDAFDGVDDLKVIAPTGSYAYNWAASMDYCIYDNSSNEYVFSDNGDGTCTLTAYNGTDDIVVVPDRSPEGLPVTAIGDSAFYYKINKLEVKNPGF